eukprot:5064795-Prymnesium_polylepis.2
MCRVDPPRPTATPTQAYSVPYRECETPGALDVRSAKCTLAGRPMADATLALRQLRTDRRHRVPAHASRAPGPRSVGVGGSRAILGEEAAADAHGAEQRAPHAGHLLSLLARRAVLRLLRHLARGLAQHVRSVRAHDHACVGEARPGGSAGEATSGRGQPAGGATSGRGRTAECAPSCPWSHAP